MRRVLGLALVPALLLFGCAAAEPVSCPGGAATDQMLASMRQSGIEPELAVSGAELEKLRAMVAANTDKPVPIADKAVLYVDPSRTRVVIIWSFHGCLSGYIQGPWPAVAEAIGAEP